MKTSLLINGSDSNRRYLSDNILVSMFIIVIFSLMPALTFGQAPAQTQDKKEADIKKQEIAVKTAQANFAKAEKAAAVSDSLISTGTQMVTDSKSEMKQLDSERKALDKEYAASKKPLDKQSNSKDKETATQAKTDLKALDTKYKADTKALDAKVKDATKKKTTGEANINKGKASKKPTAEALKIKQASLDAAQAKLDALQGNEPASTGKDKKKKKK